MNDTLSRTFNKDINIRFRFIEFIREKMNLSISLSKLKFDVNENNSKMLRSAKSEDSSPIKNDNDRTIMAIFQGLIAAIELNWINDILEFFGSSLDKLAEQSFEAVKQSTLLFITTFNTVVSYLNNSLSLDTLATLDSLILEKGEKWALENASDLIDARGIGKGFGAFISIFRFYLNTESAGSGAFTKTEDNIMNVVKLVIDIVSVFFGPVAGVLIPLTSNIVIDVSALRIKGLVFMY